MPIQIEHRDDVVEIVLDRPDVLNALDEPTVAELHGALDAIGGARALVMRGAGRGFCAGRDLSTVDLADDDGEAVLTTVFNPIVARLRAVPIPTIAAVHGACVGVGFGLAMACDVVWCAERTKIGSPFARIGAILDSGGHTALVERVGSHRALELIYTGRLLDGREAHGWGLVNAVVPDDELLPTVRRIATLISQGPTAAFRRSKALVHRILDEPTSFAAALRHEAAYQGELSGTADYVEGIGAFVQGRTPTFTGRDRS